LFTLETRVCEPLDADSIANIDRRVVSVSTNSDDLADAFVTADKRKFVSEWPVALAGVQVGVAYAGAMHLYETLSWCELLWLFHRIVIPDGDG
jgi:hypothetical protein